MDRRENISYVEYRSMMDTSISKNLQDVQRDSKEVGNMVTSVKLATSL